MSFTRLNFLQAVILLSKYVPEPEDTVLSGTKSDGESSLEETILQSRYSDRNFFANTEFIFAN